MEIYKVKNYKALAMELEKIRDAALISSLWGETIRITNLTKWDFRLASCVSIKGKYRLPHSLPTNQCRTICT